MINICEQFGIHFQVTFNDKNTQCIFFSKSNDTGYGPVTLNNKRLKLESNVNHLGNILNQMMTMMMMMMMMMMIMMLMMMT